MRLSWVTYATIESKANNKPTSALASARYRILIPMSHMDKKHYEHEILYFDRLPISDKCKTSLVSTDVAIISKTVKSPDAYEALARYIHEKTHAKIIFDICDNHFTHEHMGRHYREMVKHSDAITCNTSEMADIIRRYTGTEAHIVPDPYEWKAHTPEFTFLPDQTLVLAWYGSQTNLESLNLLLSALMRLTVLLKLKLHIVTQPDKVFQETMRSINQQYHPRLSIELHEWSIETVENVVKNSHAVVIPNSVSEKVAAKSPNRMVEALQLGRMVLATPIPAYAPFKQWTWQGDDFIQGVAWLLGQFAEIPRLVSEAQSYIAKNHAPSVAAQAWEQVCKKVTA